MSQQILKDPRDTDKERLLDTIAASGKKITVIVGLSKNAGKTTLLNWLLGHAPYSQKGIITTGRDGEEIDLVDKIKKPKVRIPSSSIFTVRASEIGKNSSLLHILEKLPYKAGSENIWLVKNETPLDAEIIGPPSVKEQIDIAKRILSYGTEHIFIDGSLDRKAIGSSGEVDSLIVTGSPAYGSLSGLRRGFKHLHDLSKIRVLTEEFDNSFRERLTINEHLKIAFFKQKTRKISSRDRIVTPDEVELVTLTYKTLLGHEKEIINILSRRGKDTAFLYIPSSITEKSFMILKETVNSLPNLRIIIKHPFHLHLDEHAIKSLRQRHLLLTLKKMEIAGFVLNSFAVNGNHLDCEQFRKTIREDFALPVIDVMEIG